MAKQRKMHEAIAERSAKRKAEVVGKLASMHGRSRAELERDDERGAKSPLGEGSHARPPEKRKGR
jgi:hypothetical protein